MLAVFLVLLAIWIVITIAAIIMIPGDPASVERRFLATYFCPDDGKEVLPDCHNCKHCNNQAACNVRQRLHDSYPS
ncbi:MAG: hypothetical protein GXP21_02610 [Gammaproteobacteria bacterium]|nr:hypothetical protein [Gammaproteobacteria bacterium]